MMAHKIDGSGIGGWIGRAGRLQVHIYFVDDFLSTLCICFREACMLYTQKTMRFTHSRNSRFPFCEVDRSSSPGFDCQVSVSPCGSYFFTETNTSKPISPMSRLALASIRNRYRANCGSDNFVSSVSRHTPSSAKVPKVSTSNAFGGPADCSSRHATERRRTPQKRCFSTKTKSWQVERLNPRRARVMCCLRQWALIHSTIPTK